MNRGTKAFITIIACAVLAVVVFFLVDMGGSRVFATPQECFDAATASLKKNDYGGFMDCLTEDSRDFLVAITIIQEQDFKERFESKGSDDQKAQIRAADAVFAKHGLKNEHLAKMQQVMLILSEDAAPVEQKRKAAQVFLEPIRDRAGFFADITKSSKVTLPFKNAKLTDVQVSGKKAMGEMTVLGERPRPLMFLKEGEGWRIDLFPQMPAQQRMPPGHHRFE